MAKKTTKVLYRSSKTGKLVKKAFAEKHKATTQKETVQGSSYWINRSATDPARDWGYGEATWIKDYVKSVDHPHRDLILEALKKLDWSYLLEVGCNAGPNLIKIRARYAEQALAGIDLNTEAVEEARHQLDPAVDLRVGSVLALPYRAGAFDVVLADAVLMYLPPEDIDQALAEIDRVASKAVILVERFAETDQVVGHVWGRNYGLLLSQLGYTVQELPITEKTWPTSQSWIKYGCVFVGTK